MTCRVGIASIGQLLTGRQSPMSLMGILRRVRGDLEASPQVAPPGACYRRQDSYDGRQTGSPRSREPGGPAAGRHDAPQAGGARPPARGDWATKERNQTYEQSVSMQANFMRNEITPVNTWPAPQQARTPSVKTGKPPTPPKPSSLRSTAASSECLQTALKKKKTPAAPKPAVSFSTSVTFITGGWGPGGPSSSQECTDISSTDGSFLERLPAAMVGEVASPVITEGPHKLAPAIVTEGPHKPAPVAPSEPRLAIPEGALTSRPESPAGGTEPDDAGASDADSGTADVMDDLPTPSTPEPDGEQGREDGSRKEDQHRVVISVTQSSSEIHGPLGCQEVPPVVVRLQPGDQGRYGFNVKGGAGSSIPVTVSKVAPRSATRCSGPRLSEGDQVVLINGVDVSNYTHREVVRFIKSCRDRQCELELTVKPNLHYEGVDDLEEPLVRFVPDTTPLSLTAADTTSATLTLTPDASPLARSIAELAHALSRGMAQLEFDGLARRELSLTMDDCRLPCNVAKNRYRDISPYDCSRVLLRTAESGDYINANFVNMEIPGSGVVNRYIAAQGPLHHTADDFWAMIWEQRCPLVVMLTTLVEQGRIKCHQYWPGAGESQLFGDILVTTVSEEVTESFAFREITLASQETGEERHLSHMQYVSWPDHGVPDQPADFVQFVQRVRSARAGHSTPTVVHCSAGIGRTGVLILMETAMCLIEANQPVYPLELVRCMRRQRAMMIQTTSQFEFVCEAVVQAHQAGTVRPHKEFSRCE